MKKIITTTMTTYNLITRIIMAMKNAEWKFMFSHWRRRWKFYTNIKWQRPRLPERQEAELLSPSKPESVKEETEKTKKQKLKVKEMSSNNAMKKTKLFAADVTTEAWKITQWHSQTVIKSLMLCLPSKISQICQRISAHLKSNCCYKRERSKDTPLSPAWSLGREI